MISKENELKKVSISGIKPKPPTYSYAVPAIAVPKPDGWKLTTDLSGVATWKAGEK
jgi:hypothetical protein